MARPRKTERRDVPLTARFTQAEAKIVLATAEQSGLRVSDLMRAGTLGKRVPASRKQADDLAAVLRQIGKIGGNVNQLAHKANIGSWPDAEAIAAVRSDIQWMRTQIMTALGTKPPEEPQP